MKEQIFISYKRLDKERVFAIKDIIEERTGAKCWIDLDGIESDAQFASVIISAILNADVFLFMYSSSHANINMDNDWTVRELNLAEKRGKRIVFINIDQSPLTDWFELMFGMKQHVDATNPDTLHRLCDDLCRWLGTSPNAAPQPAIVSADPVLDQTQKAAAPAKTKRTAAPAKAKAAAKPAKVEPTVEPVKIEPAAEPVEVEPAAQTNNERAALPRKPFRVGDFTYRSRLWDEGVDVVSCNKKGLTEIQIPSQIEYNGFTYDVYGIDYGVFAGYKSLTSVTMPKKLKDIGSRAFKACTSLTAITIPYRVRTLGDYAFQDCESLTSVTIIYGLTYIGKGAFANCKSLTSVQMRKSVTSIENEAFKGCISLTSFMLPDNISSIGENAFADCYKLSSITIPKSVTRIAKHAFTGCTSLDIVRIPKSAHVGWLAFPMRTKKIRE
jgi:hypothetical protein